jgi:glycerol kinase
VSAALLLALDLGTTGVRALLVDAGGAVRGRAWRPLETRFPEPGRVEQDPEEMWRRSVEVLHAALSEGGAAVSEVAGVGVVTQRATVLAWDAASGRPLAPAVGWQDQRTAPRVAELRAQGIPITTLPSATKFEWWLRGDGAVARAARAGTLRLGNPDAWLTWRLCGGGVHVTDPGQASCTGLYDLAAGGWSPDAAGLFAVPLETLPRVVGTAEVVGETPRSLLGARIAVAARAGDQQAAVFAQGAHAPGDAKLTLGTSAMLDLHAGAAPAPFENGVFPLALWRLEGGDAFCREASVITAGAVVDWLVDLGLLRAASDLDAVAGSVPDAGGVVFVPALQGLGTPWLDDAARGLVVGLTRGSTAAHAVRAAVEGVAQRCADLCEALGLRDGALRCDGGLARSDLLLGRVAELCNLTVLRAAETETTALGAAFLAGLATGVFADPAACAARARPAARFEPALDAGPRAEQRARFRAAAERAMR